MNNRPTTKKAAPLLRRGFLYFAVFSVLLLMFLFPKTAAQGAQNGLVLWSQTLLPILLPFLILSSLLIKLRLTRPFTSLLGPIFTRIFPVSAGACYPLLLGLLCGMPLGAKTTAQLYRLGQISEKDAMFLLGFSNQASMMFLVSYVATKQLDVPHCALLVLIVLYGSALLSTLLFIVPKHYCEVPKRTAEGEASAAVPSFFSALDACIPEGFATITRVGGYVILFSMLSAFVCALSLPAAPSALTCGILEITSGIQQILKSGLPAIQKTALTLGVTAFGGLSGLMQTKSVTLGSGLSMRYYTFVKLMQGIFAYALTVLILSLL